MGWLPSTQAADTPRRPSSVTSHRTTPSLIGLHFHNYCMMSHVLRQHLYGQWTTGAGARPINQSTNSIKALQGIWQLKGTMLTTASPVFIHQLTATETASIILALVVNEDTCTTE